MLKKFLKFLAILIILVIFSKDALACRFWAGISPEKFSKPMIIRPLLKHPKSLKSLGQIYQDGWSVGYYSDDQPVVLRGEGSSYDDPEFELAVHQTANMSSQVVMSHLRRASSGCVQGVPNPHPFEREFDGKRWLFGHNGGMKKEILEGLIGREYLRAHPPEVCTDDPPESWIDSELYFIFLLQKIEQSPLDVAKALKSGILELYQFIGKKNRALNFFLTDGQTIWAFRYGPSLYYRYDKKKGISLVASIPPMEKKKWTPLKNGALLILKPNTKPVRIRVK